MFFFQKSYNLRGNECIRENQNGADPCLYLPLLKLSFCLIFPLKNEKFQIYLFSEISQGRTGRRLGWRRGQLVDDEGSRRSRFGDCRGHNSWSRLSRRRRRQLLGWETGRGIDWKYKYPFYYYYYYNSFINTIIFFFIIVSFFSLCTLSLQPPQNCAIRLVLIPIFAFSSE